MPTIFFYGPGLDRDKKRELVHEFTQAAAKVTGLDPSAFVVYLQPVNRDHVGVGGELLDDKLKRQ